MKPHIVIKTVHPVNISTVYWEGALASKQHVPKHFTQNIHKTINDKYGISYWTTFNYPRSGKNWSDQEIASGFDRIYRLILQDNRNIPQEMVEEIRLLPEVERIHVGGIIKTDIPESTVSWSASFSSKYRNLNIGLKEAHFYSQGIPEIKIAILDTGFDMDHPEISHATLKGKDFVNIIDGAGTFIGDYLNTDDDPQDSHVGHGCHVAGIIIAKGISMPMGVVPECKIIPIKVLGALKKDNKVVGAGLIDNINNGIKWAVDNGADVINMSLGIKHTGGGLPHEDVVRYAFEKGVTIVAASGNDGKRDKYYPGALEGVIAVGATDDQGNIAPFSTYGGHVSLTAPGVNIYSSFLNQGYTVSSGTSQAAPFVTGAIALLKSYAFSLGKTLGDQSIKYLLKHSSDRPSYRFKDIKTGYGNINVLDALKLYQNKINV